MTLLSGIASDPRVCFEMFECFSCLQWTKPHTEEREKAFRHFTNKEVLVGPSTQRCIWSHAVLQSNNN